VGIIHTYVGMGKFRYFFFTTKTILTWLTVLFVLFLLLIYFYFLIFFVIYNNKINWCYNGCMQTIYYNTYKRRKQICEVSCHSIIRMYYTHCMLSCIPKLPHAQNMYVLYPLYVILYSKNFRMPKTCMYYTHYMSSYIPKLSYSQNMYVLYPLYVILYPKTSVQF
jgi:hypothetical protein